MPTDQHMVEVAGNDGSRAQAWLDVFGRTRLTRMHGPGESEWWIGTARYGRFGELVESTWAAS